MKPASGPKVVDVHVGARLRAMRKEQGLSQTQLAKRVGLTFQQIQKYERGFNRISASTLYAIAHGVFGVSVAALFEGLEDEPGRMPAADEAARRRTGFVASSEGRRLVQKLAELADHAPGHMRLVEGVVDLAAIAVKDDDDAPRGRRRAPSVTASTRSAADALRAAVRSVPQR